MPTFGSFFIGYCLYIEAMVSDLEVTIMQLDGIKRRVRWSAYIAQIRFHEEIIRFALLGFRCIFKHAT